MLSPFPALSLLRQCDRLLSAYDLTPYRSAVRCFHYNERKHPVPLPNGTEDVELIRPTALRRSWRAVITPSIEFKLTVLALDICSLPADIHCSCPISLPRMCRVALSDPGSLHEASNLFHGFSCGRSWDNGRVHYKKRNGDFYRDGLGIELSIISRCASLSRPSSSSRPHSLLP